MNNPNERYNGQETGYNYPQTGYSQQPEYVPQQSSAVYVPSSLPARAPEKDRSEPTIRVIGIILTGACLINAVRLTYVNLSAAYILFSLTFSFSNITASHVIIVFEVIKYALIAYNLGKILAIKNCAAGSPDPDNFSPFRWALLLSIFTFLLNCYVFKNYLQLVIQDLILWTFVDLLQIFLLLDAYSAVNYKTNWLRFMKPWEYDD